MFSVLLFSVINVHQMLFYLSFKSQTVHFSLNFLVSALYFHFLSFHTGVSYCAALVSVYLIFSYIYSLLYIFNVMIVVFLLILLARF